MIGCARDARRPFAQGQSLEHPRRGRLLLGPIPAQDESQQTLGSPQLDLQPPEWSMMGKGEESQPTWRCGSWGSVGAVGVGWGRAQWSGRTFPTSGALLMV